MASEVSLREALAQIRRLIAEKAEQAAEIQHLRDIYDLAHEAGRKAGLEEAKYEAEARRIDGVAEGYRRGLEEAARVAENPGFIQARDTEWDEGVNYAKRYIAAAIRALATAKKGEES